MLPSRFRAGRRSPPPRRSERASGPGLLASLLLGVLAGALWAYVPVSAFEASVPRPDRPAAQPGLAWLSVSGDHRRIVDAEGRTVLLRGFNSDALLEDSVRHGALDVIDAQLMEQSGFDVVRLPIAWSRLEPRRGTVDTGYVDEIARTVAMLNRHHLYAILDMHFLDWGPRFGGTGAPRWAALPAVPDLPWWPSENWRKLLSPAQNLANTYFWLSPDWQADFEMVWRAVAARFRDDSGVAGYDLYNEPHPLPLPPRIFEMHWMWPLYARTIDEIGAVDPNHLFIVEGVLLADLGTAVAPLHAPNVVYSPHLYSGSLVPPAYAGDRTSLARHIDDQAFEASEVPAPMLPGEFGIDHTQPHAAAWADAVLDTYDDLDAGWIWWQWREDAGWGIRNAAGTSLDTTYLRHLARPYLMAAPQRVHAGRGDGIAGSLTLSSGNGTEDASVVVAWPELTLGPPAPTDAACVVAQAWDASTSQLSLTLEPDCTVTVAKRLAT
jgi:endoglycosylceramidase